MVFPSPSSLHDGVREGLPGSLWVTRLSPPHLGSLTTTRGRTKGCQPSSKPMDTPSCDGVSCPHAQGTGQSLGCKDRMGPTRCPRTPAPAPPSGAPCRTLHLQGSEPPPPRTEVRTPGGQSTCLREAQGREAQIHLCRLTGRTTPGGALVCAVDSGEAPPTVTCTSVGMLMVGQAVAVRYTVRYPGFWESRRTGKD